MREKSRLIVVTDAGNCSPKFLDQVRESLLAIGPKKISMHVGLICQREIVGKLTPIFVCPGIVGERIDYVDSLSDPTKIADLVELKLSCGVCANGMLLIPNFFDVIDHINGNRNIIDGFGALKRGEYNRSFFHMIVGGVDEPQIRNFLKI